MIALTCIGLMGKSYCDLDISIYQRNKTENKSFHPYTYPNLFPATLLNTPTEYLEYLVVKRRNK